MSQKRCIVIGAGLAGLSSADRLESKGWLVTLVEAENMTGGRVRTHRFSEAPNLHCELGGEWIGENHERMKLLCRRFSLKMIDHRFSFFFAERGKVSKTYGPGQRPLSSMARQRFAALKRRFALMNQKIAKELDSKDWWTFLQEQGLSLQELFRLDLMDGAGESIREVSAYSAGSQVFGASSSDGMDFTIVGGMYRLVQALVHAIGSENIRLSSVARRVVQRDDKVVVHTENASFTADACICTVPTRSLEKIDFDPPLARKQRSATRQLQYVRIIKSMLLFKRRFWLRKSEKFSCYTASSFFYDATAGEPREHGILCNYAVGRAADSLANCPTRKAKEFIEAQLASLFPAVPESSLHALAIQSLAWQHNPYKQGAYSFYGPGQWFTLRPTLREPHGRVVFAGEHLAENDGFIGFMEGAVESGVSAANHLISGEMQG